MLGRDDRDGSLSVYPQPVKPYLVDDPLRHPRYLPPVLVQSRERNSVLRFPFIHSLQQLT